jgi:hypothetical protein
MSVQERLLENFMKSTKTLKEFPQYKHLLFSTGLEDDIDYNWNDESSFNIDSNLAEFTDHAVRLMIIQYMYNYPNLNFDINLLETNTDQNIFTFSQGVFRDSLLLSIEKHLSHNINFFFPFLPVVGSSHWFTLCIFPSVNKIFIINPLQNTDNQEMSYLYKIMTILCEKLKINYEIGFENSGIQTSGKSCGESTLLIFFSLLTNGIDGYKRLVKHLHKDFPINNIFELESIALGRFCKCNTCIEGKLPFNIIQLKYVECIKCKKIFPKSTEICNQCKEQLNTENSKEVCFNSSVNRQMMERGIRLGLLTAIENNKILNPEKICIKI